MDFGDRIPKELRDAMEAGRYPAARVPDVRQILSTFKGAKFIDKSMDIVAIGSCFAQELKAWLGSHGYKCHPDEWGVVYNPRSIRQIVSYSLEPQTWSPAERFWIIGGGYCDPYRKSPDHTGPVLLGGNEAEAEVSLAKHIQSSSGILRTAKLVVLTFGLTEHFRNAVDKKSFYAMPYDAVYNKEIHEFHSLSYDEVVGDLTAIVDLFERHNPGVNLLLSVSPVPLVATFRRDLGAYIATWYSKSILHAATLEVVSKHGNVHYMPSFEIAKSDPAANYNEDGRHVSRQCVERIMEAFTELYVKPE